MYTAKLDISRIDRDIVNQFLVTRDRAACGLDPDVADYILEINDAHTLFRRYPSIFRAAKALIEMPEHQGLSLSAARTRIADAINYFHSDVSMTADGWYMFYADRFEELATVAREAHDFKTAMNLSAKALDCRIKSAINNINPDAIRFKPQIVSADMEMDRMGIKKQGLIESWNSICDMVDKRELTPQDRQRLKREAARELGIDDYKVIELKNDAKQRGNDMQMDLFAMPDKDDELKDE